MGLEAKEMNETFNERYIDSGFARGTNPKRGSSTYYSAKFFGKLPENVENWFARGVQNLSLLIPHSWDPPLV